MTTTVSREQDLYGWAMEQAGILRQAALARLNAPAGIDWENLAEEIDVLGKSLPRELYSRYKILLLHLLKWRYQPALQGSSWRRTIRDQRDEVAELLAESPSLRRRRADALQRAYRKAREAAEDETGLPLTTFPEVCPFTTEQVEDTTFWPEIEDRR